MHIAAKSLKPSVCKPWLKYYSEDDIHAEMPECSLYDYLYENNRDNLDGIALNYFDREITYRELFENIQKTAQAYAAQGVKDGDIVLICAATTPEIIYSFYAMDLIGAIPNMVDPRYSPDGIREYIDEVQAEYVCTLDVAYPKVRQAVEGSGVKKVIVVSPAESLPKGKKALYRMMKPDHNRYDDNCIHWGGFHRLRRLSGLPHDPEPRAQVLRDRPHRRYDRRVQVRHALRQQF